jgi:hypothetical protein
MVESLSADLDLDVKFRELFAKAREQNAFTDGEYVEAIKELETEVGTEERELVTLKRQRKTISDDIDDVLPRYSRIEDAYTSVLATKVIPAPSKGKPFEQSTSAKTVLSFYGAVRRTDSGHVEKYCHLTGWLPGKQIKCAYIVPKSLESDELAYLFGAREAALSEPRNGMFTSP